MMSSGKSTGKLRRICRGAHANLRCVRWSCGASGGFAEAEAELGGCFAVTGKAKGAEIVEVALAAALDDGEDVVGVPEGATGGDGLHSVEREAGGAGVATRAPERGVDGDGVGATGLADAPVAGEDLVAEEAGVGPEAVLEDAVVGAESTAAFGEDFKVAPAAKGEAVGSASEGVGLDAAAGERAGKEHDMCDDTSNYDREKVARGVQDAAGVGLRLRFASRAIGR